MPLEVKQMNEGIIIGVNQNYSIVLAKGNYVKIKNKGPMTVGMDVLFTEEDRYMSENKVLRVDFGKYLAGAAALLLLFVLSTFYYNNELAVYAVITVDINPSVEVALNKGNEVIRVSALNRDGQILLEDLEDIEGLAVEEAVAHLLAQAKEGGFVKYNQDPFIAVTTVGTKGDAEERAGNIELALSAGVQQNMFLEEVTLAVFEATEEELDAAKAQGVPLVLLALNNQGKAIGVTQVRALSEDPEILEEVATEGNLYRNKYGNAYENRNDLIVFDAKFDTVVALATELEIEIPEDLLAAYESAEGALEVKEAYKNIVAYLNEESQVVNYNEEPSLGEPEGKGHMEGKTNKGEEKGKDTDLETTTSDPVESTTEPGNKPDPEEKTKANDQTDNGHGQSEDQMNNGQDNKEDPTNNKDDTDGSEDKSKDNGDKGQGNTEDTNQSGQNDTGNNGNNGNKGH